MWLKAVRSSLSPFQQKAERTESSQCRLDRPIRTTTAPSFGVTETAAVDQESVPTEADRVTSPTISLGQDILDPPDDSVLAYHSNMSHPGSTVYPDFPGDWLNDSLAQSWLQPVDAGPSAFDEMPANEGRRRKRKKTMTETNIFW